MIELFLMQKLPEIVILFHLGSELSMLQQFKMVEGMWVTATKQLNRARV
jgi:hypothetical protein